MIPVRILLQQLVSKLRQRYKLGDVGRILVFLRDGARFRHVMMMLDEGDVLQEADKWARQLLTKAASRQPNTTNVSKRDEMIQSSLPAVTENGGCNLSSEGKTNTMRL
jgi:hypothetical protein